ncbi:MAG: hypothetical protein MH204_07020 [Fimbriimonadaceae bacterium]|nr:hypothetical protein [Fimbriimonadaceae bacterium]
MECRFALLAEGANQTADRRLNILGVFEGVSVPKTPATLSRAVLVVRLRVMASEVGQPHRVEVVFITGDGLPLWQASADIRVEKGQGMHGNVDLLIPCENLALPRAGEYRFDVKINGETSNSDCVLRVFEEQRTLGLESQE